MAETAALLADEVLPERPLRQWVLSLPHALRFLLATNPGALTRVLSVVYRTISGHLLRTNGRRTRITGHTGAVTLIQRFGSALNLNIHFHMLLLDGVYLADGVDAPVFHPVAAPGANELQGLVERIAARVGQVLERRGLIERDIENAWLACDSNELGDGPIRSRAFGCDFGGDNDGIFVSFMPALVEYAGGMFEYAVASQAENFHAAIAWHHQPLSGEFGDDRRHFSSCQRMRLRQSLGWWLLEVSGRDAGAKRLTFSCP